MNWPSLKRQVARLVRLHILRDARERTVRQWYLNRGDRDLRYRYPIGPDDVVVDVGGYRGDYAAAVREKFGCHVVVFEPHPDFVAGLNKRFAQDDRVRVVACGLGSEDALLDLTDAGDASSTTASGAATLKVPVRQASAVFAELGVTSVRLLKVNIEGGEFELLPHLIESGLIGCIDHVQVQFHDFAPNAVARRNAIRAHLEHTHRLEWDYPFVWESWARRAID